MFLPISYLRRHALRIKKGRLKTINMFSDGLIFSYVAKCRTRRKRVRCLGGIPYPNGNITVASGQRRMFSAATHAIPPMQRPSESTAP
ncbi:hypothetical protein [Kingella potus]|uniref:hypothetical protein n=1 Tax=Kingella potus TaxID=265175 RepID=UPI001FD4B8C2|nr:hypothetical protein [Kingella potus]UOP01613.1 hypothetical protein LVJ84_05470 [Kingella potus]